MVFRNCPWPFVLSLTALLTTVPGVPASPPGIASALPGDQAERTLGAATSQAVTNSDPAGGPGVCFVALGDSYGAGIGTGFNGTEDDCRLGLHAYPALIHEDLSRCGRPAPAFQWRSCTGATAKDLLYAGGQVASLNYSLPIDFATLSIGGNDLGFFDVINACVFRFYSYYSGTCDAALHRAALLVSSPDFELRLDIALQELLDAVRWERHPRFAVIVTGYARFFDAATEACDESSLGVWWGGPKLPTTLRRQLNSLVLSANAKLRRTVEGVNVRFAGTRPKALFVDYDAAFEGHRFCEPGVSEPDYSRNDTWFFLVNGPDNARDGSAVLNVTASPPSSPAESIAEATAPQRMVPLGSNVVDPDSCLEPARKSGDWGFLAVCYMAMAKQKDPSLRPAHARILPQENSGWYVPTSYAKVFHPRSLGQEAIRDAIYREWNLTFGEDLLPTVRKFHRDGGTDEP